MENSEIRYYEFGDFRLDLHRRKLTNRGEFVPVTKRHFTLLLFLVENHGRILEHDEILEKVWDGLFVEQSNLKKGISALRQILQQSPAEHGFIKTVPRRGYKFDAPVRARPAIEDGGAKPGEMIFARQTNAEIIIEEVIEEEDAVKISAPESIQNVLPDATVKSFWTKISRHNIAVTALSIVTLVAAAFGVKSYFALRPIRYSAETVEIVKVTSESNLNATFVSPDGNNIVYIVSEPNGRTLRVKNLPTGSIAQLFKPANVGIWTAAFSPDGNFVYYGVENFDDRKASGLYKIPLLGGEPRRIFKQAVSHLTFAADGSNRVAFVFTLENQAIGLVVTDSDGSKMQRIATFPSEMNIDGANFSPDGAALLVTVRKKLSVNKVISYVSEFSLADGLEKIIVPEQENKIACAVWLPDKNSLLMSVRAANTDTYKIRQYFPATGEWRRVVNDNNGYRILSLARDGKTLVATREMRLASVWATENGQTDFRQISDGVDGYDRLTWTRDGRIVYESPETETGTLWIMNPDGTRKKQLSDGKDGIWLHPKISGDGRAVIFNSNRSGTRQLWRVGLDGENLTQLTDIEPSADGGELLSDNQTLIYTSYIVPNGWTIFKRNADGGTVPLSTEDASEWSISPEERFIAYSAQNEKTKKYQVFVRSLSNGELIKTFDFKPERRLCWTRDGKALAYDARKDDFEQIVIQPLDGSPPQTVFSVRSEELFWFDWSFDGAKLAVVRGKQLADAIIIKPIE